VVQHLQRLAAKLPRTKTRVVLRAAGGRRGARAARPAALPGGARARSRPRLRPGAPRGHLPAPPPTPALRPLHAGHEGDAQGRAVAGVLGPGGRRQHHCAARTLIWDNKKLLKKKQK